MQQCPKCQSEQVLDGKLVQYGGSTSAVFRPAKTRFAMLSVAGGVPLSDESFARLDCGLVGSRTECQKLRRFIESHCYASSKNTTDS